MELISSVTVGSGGAADITFSSIPQTYTDLFLLVSLRSNAGSNTPGFAIRINGDSTTSNYSWRGLYGTGNSGAAATTSSFNIIGFMTGSSSSSGAFGNGSIIIPNYTATNTKIVSTETVTENNGGNANAGLIFNRWNNTSAVTSITLLGFNSDSLVQHSTAYLYGILKGSGGATVS